MPPLRLRFSLLPPPTLMPLNVLIALSLLRLINACCRLLSCCHAAMPSLPFLLLPLLPLTTSLMLLTKPLLTQCHHDARSHSRLRATLTQTPLSHSHFIHTPLSHPYNPSPTCAHTRTLATSITPLSSMHARLASAHAYALASSPCALLLAPDQHLHMLPITHTQSHPHSTYTATPQPMHSVTAAFSA